jgi:NAD(P)-dependent dehydrogenase (short-subunit alcohol dehydrogenase family)
MSMPTSRGVVVTGAAGDLGSAVCKRLLDDGFHVLALVRRATDEVDGRAIKHVAELSLEAQVEAGYDAARAAFGAIWGSVHCAGGWAGGTIARTELVEFENMIAINLRSTFLCCRAALKRMGGQGRIVNVSAYTAATYTSIAGSAAYTAAKAGVIALTKAIADEGIPDVRANCVAPGTLRTAKNASAMPDANHDGWIPLTRVADAIAYLLSVDAPNGTVVTLPSR